MSEPQQHRLALPQGTRIRDFEFHRVLGYGGFGITYLGWNLSLDIPVAIKEYLPADLATREQDGSVVPQTSRGRQGPWTDIYALGGVCYRALTGQGPDDATDRMRHDPLVPVAKQCAGRASQELLAAVDWALSVDEGNRPQSVGAWREAMEGRQMPVVASSDAAPSSPAEEKGWKEELAAALEKHRQEEKRRQLRRKRLKVWVVVVVLYL